MPLTGGPAAADPLLEAFVSAEVGAAAAEGAAGAALLLAIGATAATVAPSSTRQMADPDPSISVIAS